MRNFLFRTSIFGGYKKEDVQSYIARLEEEIRRSQAPSGKTEAEKVTTAAQPEKTHENEDVVVLDDMQGEFSNAAPKEEPGPAVKETETKPPKPSEPPELEKIKWELAETRGRLETALAQNQNLEVEVERLREERKNYENDYSAVKDVLLNARLDAEIILTKARKEARELLENTQRQIVEQKKESAEELMRRLGENHSGLQVSKYYLEEQIKNIERTERTIETMKSRVEAFLQSGTKTEDFEAEK